MAKYKNNLICGLLFGTLALAAGLARANDPLVVHEWGTFTALQDEDGRALGGINVDDEPLPEFVHNLSTRLEQAPIVQPVIDMKGAPQRHPLVRMRLETPVVYFYPPAGQKLPLTLDFRVRFRGGWLTQFYPNADVTAPGMKEGNFRFGALTPDTVGTLAWNNLQVGVQGAGPATNSPVWTAPREVDAAKVRTAAGETENNLFYRGVSNFEAPLKVISHRNSQTFSLFSQFKGALGREQPTATVGPMWLVHIRRDGSCAFRTLDPAKVTADPTVSLGTHDLGFKESDFSQTSLHRLGGAMHKALVEQGLFDDEATALLETWRQAYFKSPGLRLFFLVPQVWTDHYLPIEISVPSKTTRVMVARIELISPEQRDLLGQLQSMEVSDPQWLQQVFDSPASRRFFEGRSNFGDLGVEIPKDFQTYLDLGRFRNALVIAEDQRQPNSSLSKFIDTYGLQEYRWDQQDR